MKCQLIQVTKVDDSNRAEIAMLEALRNLPADYFVFRELRLTPAYRDQVKGISDWVKRLMEKQELASYEICITPYKANLRAALTAAGIATFELKPREEDPGANEAGVRLGTMKRIKGLEFRAVAMACAKPDDPINNLEAADIRDRCERYVAATRAREQLLLTTRLFTN